MMPQSPRHLSAIVFTAGAIVASSAILLLHAHGDSWIAAALLPLPFALLGSGLFVALRRHFGFRAARALVLEQQMLALIRANGGRVTPAEVALHCHVRVIEARAMLELLCANGAAESVMGAQSSIAYVVPGIARRPERGEDRPSGRSREAIFGENLGVRALAPMSPSRARAITPTRSLATFSASLPPTPSRRAERPFAACAVRPRAATNPGREPATHDQTRVGGFTVPGGSVAPRST